MKEPKRTKPRPKQTIKSKEMARIAADAAYDMKAADVVVVDVAKSVNYTDYFVIASGRSTKQAQSIAENVQKAIHNAGSRPIGVEGERQGDWILIDWGAVVIHVFYHPVREFYEIEKICGDAKSVRWPTDETREN